MRERISSPTACESIPGAMRLASRRIRPRFCMSERTAAATPGILDLDGHAAAVGQGGAVDLADRGGGDRFLVELLEDVADAITELLFDHLAHVLEGHRGSRVAQRPELALELLAVLLGHQSGVEEGHDLADLHRGALHRPQRGDDLLGGLDVAPFERGFAALLGAGDVGGSRTGLPDRLPGGEPPDFRRAAHPGGRDLVLGHVQGYSAGSTLEPGTMSSAPSGQRTHAL